MKTRSGTWVIFFPLTLVSILLLVLCNSNTGVKSYKGMAAMAPLELYW